MPLAATKAALDAAAAQCAVMDHETMRNLVLDGGRAEYADRLDHIQSLTHLEHYTSSEVAAQIIRNREFWFTNVAFMNDHSEITGGLKLIHDVLAHISDPFRSVPGLWDDLPKYLVGIAGQIVADTFALSLSGHDRASSDGRLVMWRSYGADGKGACLVLKRQPIVDDRDIDFPISWIPMTCETESDFRTRVRNALAAIDVRIHAQLQRIMMIPRETIHYHLAHGLVQLALGYKHIEFAYEREVRLIHHRKWTTPIPPHMSYDAQVIRGVLRPIFKVKFVGYPDNGLPDSDMANVLERVIVGPSDTGVMQKQAFEFLLENQGIQAPVSICPIPYRGGL